MRHHILAKPVTRIAGQFARKVVHGHDGDAGRVVHGAFRFGAGVVSVERFGNGAGAQGARHWPVDVATDVGHDLEVP